MFSVPVYVYLSVLGLLWGITGSGADTAFGEMLYDITLVMMGIFGIIAIVATIGAFILRKKEKAKASIKIHIAAFGYIAAVFAVNILSGLM